MFRGGEGVVGALAVGVADGVDGRQIDHVEPHRGHRVQPSGSRAQRSADRWLALFDDGTLGAREQLVPRAEQRPAALDLEREGAGRRDQFAQRVAGEYRCDLGRERGGEAGRDGSGGLAQRVGRGQDDAAVRGLGHPQRGTLVQRGALRQDECGVDAGRDLDLRVLPPGGDRVAPGLHQVAPTALRLGDDLGSPAVGARRQLAHRGPRPRPPGRVAQHHIGTDCLVALAEDGRRDRDRLAHHGFRGTVSALHKGADIEHGNATDHELTYGHSGIWEVSRPQAGEGESLRTVSGDVTAKKRWPGAGMTAPARFTRVEAVPDTGVECVTLDMYRVPGST